MVKKNVTNERSEVSKILFLTREDKSHIFMSPCNVLFLYSPKQKIVKCHAQKQIGKSHMFNIFIREDMEIEDISLSTAI